VPTTTNDGVSLYYETDGSGETVTFVGDVGYGSWQWAWQYDELAGPYETIVWDHRGTGRSDNPPGPYDIETLTADLEAILAENSVRRTHLVGAGLGGMVALQYADRYGRASTLTLFGTAPSGTAVDEPQLRSLYPETDSLESLKDSLEGAFSPEFLSENPDLVSQICEWRTEEDADRDGVDSQLAAMCSFESPPLYEVTAPTLVLHGLADPVIDIDVGRRLAEELPRGSFETVEGRHLCHVEHAHAVTDRLDGFLLDNSEES